jgi:hypothetical protein
MTSTKSLSQSIPVCVRFSIQAISVITFAFLFLFASSASSQQAILTVQHNSGTTESGTSVTVAYNSNVTSGNLLLVAESSYDGVSLEAPTDTLGNSFVQLVAKGTSGDSVAAIYAATANASGADTVTCGVNASNNIHCHIYEVQGVTAIVDQTGNSSVTGTSLSVPTSAATTNAVDYVLAFFSDNGGSNYTPGSGWVDTEQSNNYVYGGDSAFSEDEVVTATGVQTATATADTSGTYVNVIVALVASGLPPVATPVFSPAGGSFISGQTVTISDSTSGASIYYTTNGTAPTTGSTAYAGAIAVPASETLEAIATAPG